jgi:hypothetical protein
LLRLRRTLLTCASLSLAPFAIVTLNCSRAAAQESPASAVNRTTYGEVGILDMPSAHMAPDGQLSGTIGLLNTSERFNFEFQFLPWLEGSFRYSRIAHVRGLNALYDRSFGMKMRFVQESEYIPEISLGIRDLLGTGVYGAEYIVASKRIDDFDLTAGLGWGRLASDGTLPNPLGQIFPSFKTRQTFTGGNGGTVNFGQFFHGPHMGIFGGAIWHSPIETLDLLVEYSSDRYTEEAAGGAFKVRVPVNVGVSYRPFDIATISAGWFYGTSYGVTVTFSTDPTVPVSPQKFGPQIVQPVIRPAKQQIDALTQLIARTRPFDSTLPARPFVQLPSSRPAPDSLALASALMSVGTGVHDVDVAGRTVMIDASLTQTADRQCDRYAHIVSGLAPQLETIALSDLDDPSGKVAICRIAHTGNAPADDGAAEVPDVLAPGDATADLDPAAADRKIRDDVAAQAIGVEALSVEPEMVWLYFSNRRYASEAAAAGRIARVLMADAPSSVEVFHIVSVRNGIQLRDFQITRSALERTTLAFGTSRELGDAVSIHAAPLSNPVLERGWADSYPRIHWSFGPGLREGLFDPNRPLQVQLFGAADASIEITPNLVVEGRAEANIFNNYNLSQVSNSVLPHVRSDITEYLRQGAYGVANLDALYRTRLTPDLYFEAKAGYLEDMFAGGGVQLLWRPEGERFAFGLDVYEVWQRDFNRLYGLQNYHVLTGHASVYYESPWYGLNFAVHAGRYLAGDYGATIEVTRRFSTGVEVGAFATFTNVPFSQFGEGSFDKGIIIHVPLEWALPFFSQSSYDLLLRSLTRDGGQRLLNDDSLYGDTRPDSYGEVLGHIDEIAAP